MLNIVIGIDQLLYTIFSIIYIISLNTFFLISYIRSYTEIFNDPAGITLIIYIIMNYLSLILHITHLRQIIRYYGQTMYEPVWWNLKNNVGEIQYRLLRFPYFYNFMNTFIIAIDTYRSANKCNNTMICQSLQIITIIYTIEISLLLLLSILSCCTSNKIIRSILDVPEKYSHSIIISYLFIKNYLTDSTTINYRSGSCCMICLLSITEIVDPLINSRCKYSHNVHSQCYAEWIKYYNYCPSCRTIMNLSQSNIVHPTVYV